jgi:hypothetical protein
MVYGMRNNNGRSSNNVQEATQSDALLYVRSPARPGGIYCGLLLLEAGAKKIFGLACEKTCRNDDNVGGKI